MIRREHQRFSLRKYKKEAIVNFKLHSFFFLFKLNLVIGF